MTPRTDEDEHSLEMHLPYIHKLLTRAFLNPNPDPTSSSSSSSSSSSDNNNANPPFPPLIPILVGNTTPAAEKTYGKVLAPYLADPTSVFIVSSDFCHWGARFSYTYYIPSPQSSSATSSMPFPFPGPFFPSSGKTPFSSSSSSSPSAATPQIPTAAAVAPTAAAAGYHLSAKSQAKPRPETPIHASIAHIDALSMRAVESGSHEAFLTNLRETGNTVCGRHPIGVVMAALEVLGSGQGAAGKDRGEELGAGKEGRVAKGRFKFVRYEQSSECVSVRDSSVSYASAFAVL